MATAVQRRRDLKKRLQKLRDSLSSLSMHFSMLRDDAQDELEDYDSYISNKPKKPRQLPVAPAWYNKLSAFTDGVDPVIGHLEDAGEILDKEVKL